jgi:hypothetical protein
MLNAALHGIELERRPGHLGAVGNDRSRNDRAKELGAGRIRKRLEAATERVDEAVPRGGERFLARDLEGRRVVGDVREDAVGLRAHVADRG